MVSKKDLISEIGLDKTYKTMRLVLLVACLVFFFSIVIVVLQIVKTENNVRDLKQSVVVLDSNGTASYGKVTTVSESELLRMQAENVLRIGVDYMFSFSASNYDSRLQLASNYFGSSKNEILMSYKNQNVRERVMQNNLSVDVVIKRVDISMNGSSLFGEVEYEQSFVNGTAVQKRIVVANCSFSSVKPSNMNPNGLVIESWVLKSQGNE